MERFFNQAYCLAEYCEGALQTEESGTKIANLQGRLAGFRRFMKIMEEDGKLLTTIPLPIENFPVVYNVELGKWTCSEKDYFKLKKWYEVTKQVEKLIFGLSSTLDKAVEDKKNWLFYQSTKSRDLHFVKGWYFSMTMFEDWCVAIADGYIAAKKAHEEELQFDEEEEE